MPSRADGKARSRGILIHGTLPAEVGAYLEREAEALGGSLWRGAVLSLAIRCYLANVQAVPPPPPGKLLIPPGPMRFSARVPPDLLAKVDELAARLGNLRTTRAVVLANTLRYYFGLDNPSPESEEYTV